ncbi:MAG: protease modulator HflC [Acidobacteriota bacterium]
MNRGLVVLLIIMVIVALAASSFLYVIDEREQVVITRFGRPIRTVAEPGLHFKAPFVDTVNVFDKRVLAWDGSPDQIPTSDKKYIFVDTFARWRIVDPLRFFQSVRDKRQAQLRLDDIIDGATRDVISSNTLVEVVRNSNRQLPIEEESGGIEIHIPEVEIGRDALTEQVFERAREKVQQSFGLELLDMQIKRINYVKEVREKVFERMISERKRIAELFRSEGQRNLQEIGGTKDKRLKEITSEAYRQAQFIRGGADAEAARIYADAYGQDVEFYQFSKTLSTLRQSLSGDSKLLLTTDSDYFKYLKRHSPRP